MGTGVARLLLSFRFLGVTGGELEKLESCELARCMSGSKIQLGEHYHTPFKT